MPRVRTNYAQESQAGEVLTALTANSMWDLEPVLEVWVHDEDRPPLVTLTGRLDRSTETHVRDLLNQLLDDRVAEVVVDLTGVEIGDESDIAVLWLHPERTALGRDPPRAALPILRQA
jgi:hypothetical protein